MKKKHSDKETMTDTTLTITCPYCQREISLDQALTHQITQSLRKEYDEEVRRKEQELKAKERIVLDREKQLRKSLEEQEQHMAELKEKLQDDFAAQLQDEKKKIEAAAAKKAQESSAAEIKAVQEELQEKARQVKEFTQRELQLRKEKAKLEEDRQRLELDVARKIDEEKGKIREEVAKHFTEQYRLKDVEKDRHIESLKVQIEELQRKVEQGPGERGEALEWVLETALREQFRNDVIEPVPRGMRGADVTQRVCSPSGNVCGTIIWESKRVKNWSDGWIEKLKEDQREAKADIAVLVSTVLPRGITGIHQLNGVWVADYTLAIGLATALRHGLMEIAAAKTSMEGRSEKLEMLYDYLSGPQFRQQIEAIVDAFVSMSKDLDQERRAMEKIWAKREKQIDKVVKNTSRMYGSLQGIVGSTLPELKTLELKALEGVEDR